MENEKGWGLPIRACPLPVHPQTLWVQLSEDLTYHQMGVVPISHLPCHPTPSIPGVRRSPGRGHPSGARKGAQSGVSYLGMVLTLAVQNNLLQSRPYHPHPCPEAGTHSEMHIRPSTPLTYTHFSLKNTEEGQDQEWPLDTGLLATC